MITDYEEDAHFCIKCHITIVGLDNYINHRKAGCSKNVTEPPKSPLPSQLLSPDESFNLKADDFFSSLELRSSSKKSEVQSTSGKNFSGILTRSKTTAAIQASSTQTVKEPPEPQQSKSGKNVWIGGHQLKELGHGDNQSKLIKAVDNLERRKEEPPKLEVYEESEEDSEEYDYDDEDTSSDDQDAPPRHHTGGKWKPSSPIQWNRTTSESRDWNIPPPNFTGGKWKPKRPSTPPTTGGKVKWKPPTPQKEDYSVPPPSFTGSKWVSKKTEEIDVPPPTFTGSKWVASKRQDADVPPPTHTKGKWKPKGDEDQYATGGKGKWKPSEHGEEDAPPANYTKGKWKPSTDEEEYPPPSHTKGKWKPKENEEELTPTSCPKEKWKPKSPTHNPIIQPSTLKIIKPVTLEKPENPEGNNCIKGKWVPVKQKIPEESYTKGKWKPIDIIDTKCKKKSGNSLLRKSSGTVQYWCNPCNRRLASKIVYERHLKSELHFKRTSRDTEFDDTDDLSLINEARRTLPTPPEHIFSNQDTASQGEKKRHRKKLYERCEVCHSKVQKYLIGKHLISHYHCRKGNIRSEVAKNMVLEHIHGVVLESPFQCSICKFYCNTQEDFLRHWLSSDHINRRAPGCFFCILCKFESGDTELMYKHLTSPEHMEVVSVINRSVPIVIKKICPTQCVTCGKQFMLNMQLLNHCRKFKHDESQLKKFRNDYVCDICGLGHLSNVGLRRHKENVHKQKYYICTTCDLKFKDINEAKRHRMSQEHKHKTLQKKHKGSNKKKCQYCGACFGNFFLLKQHLNSEHPDHNIRCPHCGANFAIAQELTCHLRSKLCKFEETPETSENTLRCERCPFFSNSVSELLFHMALHEEPLVTYQDPSNSKNLKTLLKYKCPVCEKFFPKSSLHAHIRQHTQERPFECQICGKNFARKNNLQYHIKNHDRTSKVKVSPAERSFLCYMCGANFKKKAILQQHLQIHTGKACKCPHPGCIFAARKMSEIKEHFKIHLDEKNFACEFCDYKGKTKSHLTRHMSMHKDNKKIGCPQCSFSTRNSQHLRRHLRIHTGAKPYSCPHCNYRCSNLENLRKHVLSTVKHVGKFLYECRFCSEVSKPFESNFAKEFKVHLVTSHPDIFNNGSEAASFVAGLYDFQNDCTQVYGDQNQQEHLDQSGTTAEKNENILNLNTDVDPIVCQPDVASTSKDGFVIENLPDSWSLVGRYDVEEASGTLIPFESDSESIFQEHF